VAVNYSALLKGYISALLTTGRHMCTQTAGTGHALCASMFVAHSALIVAALGSSVPSVGVSAGAGLRVLLLITQVRAATLIGCKSRVCGTSNHFICNKELMASLPAPCYDSSLLLWVSCSCTPATKPPKCLRIHDHMIISQLRTCRDGSVLLDISSGVIDTVACI
jgi:hypothetical protein